MSAHRDYISARNVTESVRQSRLGDYTYLNNAKSGCSTIKYLLWLSEYEQGRVDHLPSLAELHQEGLWPRGFRPIDGSAPLPADGRHRGLAQRLGGGLARLFGRDTRRKTFVFSFVRNPFVRAFSCYRDKITRPNLIRDRFCLKYGLDPKQEISFVGFLETIRTEFPCDEDQHWRPQHHNVMVGSVPIDFIGNLEHYDDDIDALRGTIGLSTKGEVKNAYKQKSEKLMQKSFTDSSIRLVLDKYRDDFETFGYGEDVSILTPIHRRKGSGVAPRARGNLSYVNLLGSQEAAPTAVLRALVALSRNVDNPYILETAYSLARRQGEIGRAGTIAEDCAARFPDYHVSLWLSAQEALRTNRTDRARELANALTRARPDSDPYWRLLHELTPQDDGEAVRNLSLLNPQSADWQLRRAEFERSAGNSDGAREAYERALRADPASAAASAGLAALASAEVEPR